MLSLQKTLEQSLQVLSLQKTLEQSLQVLSLQKTLEQSPGALLSLRKTFEESLEMFSVRKTFQKCPEALFSLQKIFARRMEASMPVRETFQNLKVKLEALIFVGNTFFGKCLVEALMAVLKTFESLEEEILPALLTVGKMTT
ncbi:hypothetical protein ACOMHN_018013 [Nucella lapillus]